MGYNWSRRNNNIGLSCDECGVESPDFGESPWGRPPRLPGDWLTYPNMGGRPSRELQLFFCTLVCLCAYQDDRREEEARVRLGKGNDGVR